MAAIFKKAPADWFLDSSFTNPLPNHEVRDAQINNITIWKGLISQQVLLKGPDSYFLKPSTALYFEPKTLLDI